MKVIVDRGNAPQGTGTGVYTDSLLHAIKDYYSADIIVNESDACVTGTTLRPLRRLAYLYKLNRLRSHEYNGAQVVHFTNVFVPKRCHRVAYVGNILDLDPIQLPSAHTIRYSTYFRMIVSKIIERAHLLLTISNAVCQEVKEKYNVDEDRIRVAEIGLSRSFTDLASKYPKTIPDIPVFLFVGQLNRKKNIAWLINAFVAGVKSGALPKMNLLLAGRAGYGFSEIRKELKQAGSIVQWKNALSMDEIVQLYCACSVVVVPSLREGFGLPLLEAMHCDKPIVASNIPTSIEVAGKSAEFFTLNNKEEFYHAMKTALADVRKEERRHISAERLIKYSWKELIKKYYGAYIDAQLYC